MNTSKIIDTLETYQSLPWLSEHRKTCPEDADEATVEWYARAYLWYLLTEVVFPDSSGNSAN